MKAYEIDTAKMPLGKSSKAQIQKAQIQKEYDITGEIDECIKAGGNRAKLN
jgi:hypothetical protein